MRIMIAIAMTVVVLTAATACSNGDGGGSASTETTTTVATTTVATTGPPPPAGTIPFIEFGGASPADGVSAAGSGCAPPSATSLPDGQWFGILKAVDAAAGTVGLDLACLFGGTAADAAAKADGSAEIPVPNGHWTRNQSPNVYTEHAVAGVSVGVLTYGQVGGVTFSPTEHGLAAAAPLVGNPVWLEVTGGWVTTIQEQYFP